MMKRVRWMGTSRRDVRSFPVEARSEAGFQLQMVQVGDPPLDWKPMSSIGPGVIEIRIHRSDEFRVLYVAKFAEAIYVLHCFAKKTKKTDSHDLELARERYRELITRRTQKES